MSSIRIGDKSMGEGLPVFVVAEIGVNHNGDRDLLRRLLDAAVQCGVDAVKFQAFSTDKLATVGAPKAEYQEATTSPTESQYQLLKRLELSQDSLRWLMDHTRQQGIIAFATPFDEGSADLLGSLGVPAFKIGSGDLTNLPLLRHVAGKDRPMVVSTGMATLGEVEDAVQAVRQAGCHDLILCHTTSNYPAVVEDANLRVLGTIRQAFQVPIGFSDHTMGLTTSLGAVALGAVLIEKHLTLDRSLPGPDQKASLEPHEFRQLVVGVREMEAALGSPIKQPQPREWEVRRIAFRSLVATCDIPKGMVIQPNMLSCKRPGTGIEPKYLELVVGRTAKVDIKQDEVITWDRV